MHNGSAAKNKQFQRVRTEYTRQRRIYKKCVGRETEVQQGGDIDARGSWRARKTKVL